MTPRAVILAAGTSRRMGGSQKLLMPYLGIPMIEYAIAAAHAWNPVIVAGPDVAEYLSERRLAVVRNEHPERGMSHSLLLADRALPDGVPLIVLLGDKPLITMELIGDVLAGAGDADIAHPERDGVPGHPVFFSAKARGRIGSLPPGDSLRLVRDDPHLLHARLDICSEGAFFDIDTPGDALPASE